MRFLLGLENLNEIQSSSLRTMRTSYNEPHTSSEQQEPRSWTEDYDGNSPRRTISFPRMTFLDLQRIYTSRDGCHDNEIVTISPVKSTRQHLQPNQTQSILWVTGGVRRSPLRSHDLGCPIRRWLLENITQFEN